MMFRYAVLLLCCITFTTTNQQQQQKQQRSGDLVFPSINTETERTVSPPLPTEQQKLDKVEAENGVDSRRRYEVASEAVHGVATRLHTLLDPTGSKNYVVSPLSISVIVAQLLLGARGMSQRRMRELLSTSKQPLSDSSADAAEQELHKQLGGLLKHLQVKDEPATDDPSAETEENFYQLKAASAFFLQRDLQMKKNYWQAIRSLYDSDFLALDFGKDPLGSLRVINQWGATNTGGLIPEILSRPLPPSTAILLVNSIYFRADWETPFSAELTVKGPFKLNGSHLIDVQYMRGQFEIKYAESKELECKLIILPYKQKDVNMYIILPNSNVVDVKQFSTKITPQDITNLIKSSTDSTVTLVMPKMKLKSSFSLKDPIMNYRPQKQVNVMHEEYFRVVRRNKTATNDPKTTTPRTQTTVKPQSSKPKPSNTKPSSVNFSGDKNKNNSTVVNNENTFDLSGASNDPRFVVHEILHEVSLEVSETGTEAAAVSIGSVDYSGDVRSMKLERPFLFFIRHEESAVNLFWGVVMDPTNGNWS